MKALRRRSRLSSQHAALCALSCVGCQVINDSSEFVIARLSVDAGVAESGRDQRLPPPLLDCRNEVTPKRCAGDVPEQCSEAGRWEAAGAACPFGCQNGACNQCVPDSLTCEAGVQQRCSGVGRWLNLAACPVDRPVCSEGACSACIAGAHRCSPLGTPQTCGDTGTWRDEAACPDTQVCVPGTGVCGQCSAGDTRFCIHEKGKCAEGQQTCRADSSWEPCTISPAADDTCAPGDDSNCDGTPNAPRVPCGCDEGLSQACGPDEGECSPGSSVCVNGTPGPCTGDVPRAARNCSSPLDNDCDGRADDTLDAACRCHPSEVPEVCPSTEYSITEYPNQGLCSPPVRRCIASANGLSSDWSACEGGVARVARDCTSAEDNDCDGVPDAASCDCPYAATQLCGQDRCSGTRTCLLSEDGTSTHWGDCELPGDWTFQAPERLSGLGLGGDLWGPASFDEGRSLVFGGAQTEDLFFATRSDRGAVFSVAMPITTLNTASLDGTPFVTYDGLELYFYSTRPGGAGNRDIWVATTPSAPGAWATPTVLANINSASADQNPWVSPDGLSIVFDSDRPGGAGGADLWLARRSARTGPFGAAVSVTELNTSASDEGAALTSDGLTIFFASSRPGGQGDLDIWVATRRDPNNAFSPPRNLMGVNSGDSELDPGSSPDGRELFFSSSRDGLQQLYRAIRICD